jgi:hypothetical protein
VFAAVKLCDNEKFAVATRTIAAPADHPLAGTWITEDEDSDVAYTFSAKNNRFRVSGFCRSDGEAFEIKRVKWDGKALSFIARLPSTDFVTKHVFRVRPDGKTDHELTTYEVWKKKDVRPGELPEAWRPVSRPLAPHIHIRRAPKPRKS